MTELTELWELVSKIPPGRCTNYGALGSALSHPTTGRMVGRWMTQCPPEIPWWRVVNKQGGLPVGKLDPFLAMQQRQLLESEGVAFKEEVVDLGSCFWEPAVGDVNGEESASR